MTLFVRLHVECKVLDLAILEVNHVSLLLVEQRGDAKLVLGEHGAVFGLGHDEAAIDRVLDLLHDGGVGPGDGGHHLPLYKAHDDHAVLPVEHRGPDTVVQQLDQGSGLVVKPGGGGEYMNERMTIRSAESR